MDPLTKPSIAAHLQVQLGKDTTHILQVVSTSIGLRIHLRAYKSVNFAQQPLWQSQL